MPKFETGSPFSSSSVLSIRHQFQVQFSPNNHRLTICQPWCDVHRNNWNLFLSKVTIGRAGRKVFRTSISPLEQLRRESLYLLSNFHCVSRSANRREKRRLVASLGSGVINRRCYGSEPQEREKESKSIRHCRLANDRP